jgi:predicted permease
VLLVALAIVASVAAGVGAERRWGERTQAAVRRMLDAMLFVALPFISFFVIAHTELTTGVGVGLVLTYAELAATGLLAWWVARRLLGCGPARTATLIVCAIMANTGYLGIPLVAALLGRDELGAAITFDAIVSGPMFVVVAFAIAAAFTTQGEPLTARLRAFAGRNPPLIAIAAALVAPDALAPDALVDLAEVAAIALLPVGFFVLGVTLAAEAEEGAFAFPPPLTRAVAAILALRLAVAPALLLALSALTVDVPDAYLVQAAMPVGINTLVVAHAYNLDLRLASGAVAWSTAIVVAAAAVAALAL